MICVNFNKLIINKLNKNNNINSFILIYKTIKLNTIINNKIVKYFHKFRI